MKKDFDKLMQNIIFEGNRIFKKDGTLTEVN